MTNLQKSGFIEASIDLEASLLGGQSFRWAKRGKFFRGIIKKVILEFQQEWRSVDHSDFMRPLFNRWPVISEPLSDQAEVTADLVDFPKFVLRKTEIK